MIKGFWSKTNVLVIGGGNFGTVLSVLASKNVHRVHVLVRDEAQARQINSTRQNPDYHAELNLNDRITAYVDPERAFKELPISAVVWALPSQICRAKAQEYARFFTGEEVLIHATKGVEHGSLKRMSEILLEELPLARVGVLSGPNLATEMARGEPAGAVLASRFDEVIAAGRAIFTTDRFSIEGGSDVIGVEWAGALKNILAIASGVIGEMGLGYNSRALLLSKGLVEMVRFGSKMGAKSETFLGLAGMGDLLATCSSNLSRNYRVGQGLAQNKSIVQILEELDSEAEGVSTTRNVFEYAREQGIKMPITQGVYDLIEGKADAQRFLKSIL